MPPTSTTLLSILKARLKRAVNVQEVQSFSFHFPAGFSCSDLQQLLCEAAMGPVREVAAARIRQSGDATAALLEVEHFSPVLKHLQVHRETAPTK